MSHEIEKEGESSLSNNRELIALGAGFGVALGAAIGATFGEIELGVGVGIALGTGVGAVMMEYRNRKDPL